MSNIFIDACRIRPITFDRDKRKIMMFDEVSRDSGAHAVELRRPVTRLTDQYDARCADATHQRREVNGFDGGKAFAAAEERANQRRIPLMRRNQPTHRTTGSLRDTGTVVDSGYPTMIGATATHAAGVSSAFLPSGVLRKLCARPIQQLPSPAP